MHYSLVGVLQFRPDTSVQSWQSLYLPVYADDVMRLRLTLIKRSAATHAVFRNIVVLGRLCLRTGLCGNETIYRNYCNQLFRRVATIYMVRHHQKG